MKLTVNSEYMALVPSLTPEEYDSLKESIKENGLYLPIITTQDGVILDGHNRFQICQELGVELKHAVRTFDDILLEKKFVIECNLKRRQLNDFQKIELGIPLIAIEAELAKRRMGTPEETNTRARDVVAKQIGVSGTTFERSKKIIENAPEQVKQVLRDGKSSISKEYQKLRKDEKKTIRQEEISKHQVILPENVTLHNKLFQNIFIDGNSVSLIITDPPYHEKDLLLYNDLAVHASRVLRDGGSLLCYVGHYAIGRVITMMEKAGLKFQWPMAIIHGGPTAAMFGRKVLVGYMPMLWFVKGKYEGEFVRDVIQSEFQGKELHEWAKSTVESDYFIKYMTIPNEIVYDPFMGQGTFGVSAIKQGRQFIGCEINSEHFENAKRLISIAK